MPDDAPAKTSNALIHIDGDSQAVGEAAKLFLQIVNDAVGGWLKPWQIRRVADAEADAKLTHAMADIRATSLQKRAAQRWLAEEEAKQANMESITAKALPHVKPDAQPGKIERDWLTNFFDKSRLTSDAEMQELWAKILAGEANAPGKFSKRAISLMATLGRDDAAQFQILSRFCFWIDGKPQPLVFSVHHNEKLQALYLEYGVEQTLGCLEEIGLIRIVGPAPENPFETSPDMLSLPALNGAHCRYHRLEFEVLPAMRMPLGRVMLTRVASELASICSSDEVPNFAQLVLEHWSKNGVVMKPGGAL